MQSYKRRRLLQYGMAAAVLTAAGLPVRAQQSGGVLKAGLTGARVTDSWDARTHRDTFMIAAAQGAVFDTLTEVGADGSLIGELAESWDCSADARVWTFDLRKGVTFHNGHPFGAEDVLASFALHMDSASGARPIVETIEDMRALGTHQVQFTLTTGNADFPYLVSDYHLLIYPAAAMQEAMRDGIGTGLYRVEHFSAGERFIGKRVNGHYKDGRAGWFDTVDFRAIPDGLDRMSALVTGQVDAINRVDLARKALLATNDSVRLIEVAGNQHYSFPMNVGAAPYSDMDVRMALKHGIDREAMLKEVLRGHGTVAHDSPIGPANQYFHAGLEPVAYDPERARFHLKRAGLDQVNLQLSVQSDVFEGAREAAALFARSAQSSGIGIDVVESAGGAQPWAASYWSGRATEDWMLSMGYMTGAPLNETGWSDPRFDALLVEARAELDSDKRRMMYAELQTLLRNEGGAVIPVFANMVQAVSKRIATPDRIGNLWQMDNSRMAERWWAV